MGHIGFSKHDAHWGPTGWCAVSFAEGRARRIQIPLPVTKIPYLANPNRGTLVLRSLALSLSVASLFLASCSSPQVEPSVSNSKYVDTAGRFRATLQPGWEVHPTERGGVQFINPKSRGAITLIMFELPIATGASGNEWKPLMSLEAAKVAAAGKGRSVRRWTGSHGPLMVTALYDYDDVSAEAEKPEAEAILASVEFSGKGSRK